MIFTKDSTTAKFVSASFILSLLLFVLGVVPHHVAAPHSHDTCQICTFIHHPPDLQSADPALTSINLPEEVFPKIFRTTSHQDPDYETFSSRAPPSQA